MYFPTPPRGPSCTTFASGSRRCRWRWTSSRSAWTRSIHCLRKTESITPPPRGGGVYRSLCLNSGTVAVSKPHPGGGGVQNLSSQPGRGGWHGGSYSVRSFRFPKACEKVLGCPMFCFASGEIHVNHHQIFDRLPKCCRISSI